MPAFNPIDIISYLSRITPSGRRKYPPGYPEEVTAEVPDEISYRPSNTESRPDTIELLRQHLTNMPQRESPSVGRKLLGSLVGAFQGVDVGRDVIEAPHRRKMEDWGQRAQSLGTLAGIEQKKSESERRYAKDAAEIAIDIESNRLKGEDIERKRTEAQDRLDIALKNATTSEGRLQAYQDYVKETGRHNVTSEGLRKQEIESKANRRSDPKPISASEQKSAMGMAVSTAITNNPEFKDFIQDGKIVRPDENDMEAVELYKRFTKEVDREKQKILGQTRSSSRYTVEEEEEDEDNFDIELE